MKINFKLISGVVGLLAICYSCSSRLNADKKSEITNSDTSTAISSMRYLENKRIKIGIDLKLGGSVTFLSDQENGGHNMINSYDWGRQIQMSFYSGPWPYIGPNGETPSKEWEGLGWNPIQAGDAGHHRSKILSFEKRGENSMLVRSVPMQWPHKTGVAGECVFETLYTLDGNVITMEATLINNRADTIMYHACAQEMPAVYTNGPWHKIVTYLGDQPFTDQKTTNIVDKGSNRGWPWVHFYTPENWVAIMDDHGKGIGIFQPEVMDFNAGFHPNDSHKGSGGERDVPTGHVAPIGKQILDHNIVFSYKTAFILGTVDDIRSYAKENWNVINNPEWKFEKTRSNWYYEGNIKDQGFPIRGNLDLSVVKGSALVGPTTFWKAEEASFVEIESELSNLSKPINIVVEIQPIGKSDFTDYVNWTEGEFNVESEYKEKAVQFPKKDLIKVEAVIQNTGKFNTLKIPLSDIPHYSGAMKQLRIAFQDPGNLKIKRIKLSK